MVESIVYNFFSTKISTIIYAKSDRGVDFLEIAGRRAKVWGPESDAIRATTALAPARLYSACTAYYSCLWTRSRSKRSTQTGINQYCNYWATVTLADGTCPVVSRSLCSRACAISPPVGVFESWVALVFSRSRTRAQRRVVYLCIAYLEKNPLLFQSKQARPS